VITGGAGTGKTTIIAEILHHLERKQIKYQLVSFTGKAVGRMKEVTKRNSPSTLHRLIYKKDIKSVPRFQYLIVDEASMVTIRLFMQFYAKYCPSNGFTYKIILVGDPHQLPPIPNSGPGMFFSQIVESGLVKTYRLVKNHRCDLTGDGVMDGIKLNAVALIDKILGDPDDDIYTDYYEGSSEFRFTMTDNFTVMGGGLDEVTAIIDLLRMINPSLRPRDIKVICPYRNRKDASTGAIDKIIDNLNHMCQRIYETGSEKSLTDSRGVKWRVDDLVRLKKNNYAEGLEKMNGEEGIIVDILDPNVPYPKNLGFAGDADRAQQDLTHSRLIIQFHDGTRVPYVARYTSRGSYHPRSLDVLIHAYAATVHEAQGSEWEYVIGYLPDPNLVPDLPPAATDLSQGESTNDKTKFSNDFLNYQLTYVLLTRARKGIFLIGDVEELTQAATRKPARRWDRLAERIKNGIEDASRQLTGAGPIAPPPTHKVETRPTHAPR